MALAFQQADLGSQCVEVAGGHQQRPLQGGGGLGVVVFVQVQARQMHLGVGILGLLLQGLLVLLEGCLQRAEIQADGVGVEAQQGIHGGKAHALLFVVQQRA
ncbi:hypothetical protein D3C81_1656140 [compost metagenome]